MKKKITLNKIKSQFKEVQLKKEEDRFKNIIGKSLMKLYSTCKLIETPLIKIDEDLKQKVIYSKYGFLIPYKLKQ